MNTAETCFTEINNKRNILYTSTNKTTGCLDNEYQNFPKKTTDNCVITILSNLVTDVRTFFLIKALILFFIFNSSLFSWFSVVTVS